MVMYADDILPFNSDTDLLSFIYELQSSNFDKIKHVLISNENMYFLQ